MLTILVVIAVLWLDVALLNAHIAKSKNRPFTKWFYRSLLFGPLGSAAVIIMKAIPAEVAEMAELAKGRAGPAEKMLPKGGQAESATPAHDSDDDDDIEEFLKRLDG